MTGCGDFRNTPGADRRKHQRYKVRTGAYAAFVPHSNKRGRIIDISEGGLAFQYIAPQKHSGKGFLSILVNHHGVFLNHVSCWVASDLELTTGHPFSIIPMRRCGVSFGDLSREQKQKIFYFIKNFTNGPA